MRGRNDGRSCLLNKSDHRVCGVKVVDFGVITEIDVKNYYWLTFCSTRNKYVIEFLHKYRKGRVHHHFHESFQLKTDLQETWLASVSSMDHIHKPSIQDHTLV